MPELDAAFGHADHLVDAGPTFRDDLAILGQRAARTVDLGGSELHQLLAQAMERQDRLPFLAPECN